MPRLPAMKTRALIQPALVVAGLLLTPVLLWAEAPSDPSAKQAESRAKHTKKAKAARVHGVLRTAKTDMGVRVDYTMDTPSAGQTTEVRLKIEGNEAGRPLSIELVAGDGLRLARGLPGGSGVQTSAAATHVVAITPAADGLYYLHVFLRAGGMSEALAIAVPVGKAQALVKPVTPQTMPDGRSILSIPAQQ